MAGRTWGIAGQNKTSGTTVATTTASVAGPDFPQVGDKVFVAVWCDNLTQNTPTLTSVAVSGAGAIAASPTIKNTNNSSTTAGANGVMLIAICTVTTAFTSATVITATISAAVTAKNIIVLAATGIIGIELGPTAGGYSGNNDVDAITFVGAPNTSAITGLGSTISTATSGGSATTNVRSAGLVGDPSTFSPQANITGSYSVIVSVPSGSTVNQNPADTADGSDSLTEVQNYDRPLADTAAGSDSLTAQWNRATTFTDTAAGSDSLVTGAPPLFTEPFTSGLPSDITNVACTWDGAVGQPPGSLHTFGDTPRWVGKPGSRWDITGDFVYSMEFKIDSGADVTRDIYNLLFWGHSHSGDPNGNNDMDGFVFRLQTQAADGGFYLLSNNSLGGLGSAAPVQFAGVPPDTWITFKLTVAGTTATAEVRDKSTGTLIWPVNVANLSSFIDADHPTRGVFGQKADGAASATGTWIDNISVVGTANTSTTVNANLSDTAAGADSLAAQWVRAGGLADVAGGTDALGQTATRTQTPADVAAGADALGATFTRAGGLVDTAAGSDSLTTLASLVRQLADTAAGSDVLSAIASLDKTLADVAAGSDAMAGVWLLDEQLADTATGSDSLTSVLARISDLADTAAGADSLTVTWSRDRSIADAATATDALGELQSYDRALADTADGADSFTVLWSRDRQFADSANGSDTMSGQQGSSVADTATGSDAVTVIWNRSASLADTAAGSDALSKGAILQAGLADTAAGSDALSSTRSIDAQLADSALGLDSIGITWSRVMGLADTAAGADSLSSSQSATGNANVNDVANGADAVSVVWQRDRSIADGAAGGDALGRTSSFVVTLSDTASGADALTTAWSRARSLSSPAVGGDSLDGILILAIALRMGNIQVKKVYLGTTPVKAMFLGSARIM